MTSCRKLTVRDAHELRALRAQLIERIDSARRAVTSLGISRNDGVLRAGPLETALLDLRAAQVIARDLTVRCGRAAKP